MDKRRNPVDRDLQREGDFFNFGFSVDLAKRKIIRAERLTDALDQGHHILADRAGEKINGAVIVFGPGMQTHLREDLDVIDEFSQHAACDHQGLTTPPGSFDTIQTLLSPAVCYHLYFALADKPLPSGGVVATAVGNCFRYEAINLASLERMWNFTMREVIFVGPKDLVLENREIARQRMAQFFEGIGLAYRVESANDPFFIGEFRKQAAFQSAFQLKYEIRASLPYKDSTLAVGSYNYHQDFFGRSLNISLPCTDGPVYTEGIADFAPLDHIVVKTHKDDLSVQISILYQGKPLFFQYRIHTPPRTIINTGNDICCYSESIALKMTCQSVDSSFADVLQHE